MSGSRLVVMALSAATAVAVVASVLLLRPTGAEVESDDDVEAAIMSDSADFPEIRDGTVRLVAWHDYLIGHAVQTPKPRTERPASHEYAGADEYLDPDALYPASPTFGGVIDAGEFLDPDEDIAPPPPAEGGLEVGAYLAPEKGP